MTSTRKYFTLCTRENGVWAPQFGDYSRAVVVQEAADAIDSSKSSWSPLRRADTKIITTTVRQAEIDAAVAEMNELARTIAMRFAGAVMDHAMANYGKDGWDFVVETMTVAEIAADIGNCDTEKAAISHMRRTAKLLDEQRRDVMSTAF